MKLREKLRLHTLVLIAMIVLYMATMGIAALHRHWAFQSSESDLGLNHQPVWATLQGHPFHRTGGVSLEDHFEPLILLISPLLLIWSGAETLLLLQVLILALGAIPAYLLARDILKDEALALAIAAMYLLLPSQESANLADFHAAPLAAPLFLFACYYAYKKRLTGAVVFSLLAMSAREDMGYLALLIGIYLFFKVSKRWGAALSIVGVLYSLISFGLIIPHYAQAVWGRKSAFTVRYSYLLQGSGGFPSVIVRVPVKALGVLLSRSRIGYAVGLLAGTGFIPIFGLDFLLLGVPFFLLNALSNYPGTYSGEIYYSTILAPFLVLGTIAGAKRILRLDGKWIRTALIAWVVLFSVGYNHLRGFTPLTWGFSFKEVTPHNRELRHFQELIPRNASLATTTSLYPHFSDRMTIYALPTIGGAQYILIDVTSNADMHPADLKKLYENALKSGYGIVEAKDGYILLKKGAKSKTLPDGFYNFARVKSPKPRYRSTVKFDNGLTFLGLDVIRYREGKLLKVRSYWHVDTASSKRMPQLFLEDVKGNVMESIYDPPSPWLLWYPPSKWKPGENIVVETVPWNLGRYFVVEIGTSTGTDWKQIGKRGRIEEILATWDVPTFSGRTSAQALAIERRGSIYCKLLPLERCVPRQVVLPVKPTHTTEASFGGKVELMGYDVRQHKGSLEVTLYWKPTVQLVKGYSSFVHLTDGGKLLSQHDGAPKWYTLMATPSWVPGRIYRDDHVVHIPKWLPPGKYYLDIGMYDWKDLKHLEVNGKDAFRITVYVGKH